MLGMNMQIILYHPQEAHSTLKLQESEQAIFTVFR